MSERVVWRLAAASGILYVAVGLAHGGGGDLTRERPELTLRAGSAAASAHAV